MDMFAQKCVLPMLIGHLGEPFDGPDYLYELKWDGTRCLAYLDVSGGELRNKRNVRLSPLFPELSQIHRQVGGRCILDGELCVLKDGAPDFSEVQRRSLLTDRFKISLAAKAQPASLIVFDLLYWQDQPIVNLPLTERKELLTKAVMAENERLAVSRFCLGQGTALYDAAAARDLEGVVAKQQDSLYYPGKRTQEWIKIKNLQDDDFAICGYIRKPEHIVSLILGQFDQGKWVYKGHVTMGVAGPSFARVAAGEELAASPFPQTPSGNEQAVWLRPVWACTVKYREQTPGGSLRQPVFKGLREDKTAQECTLRE